MGVLRSHGGLVLHMAFGACSEEPGKEILDGLLVLVCGGLGGKLSSFPFCDHKDISVLSMESQ